MMDPRSSRQVHLVQLRQASPAEESSPPALARPSFPELFEANARYVWLALRRLGVREEDLEDVTHDVFIQVIRHWDSYDPERPIKPWLFGFAFRVASDHRRKARVRKEVVTEQVELAASNPTGLEALLTKERMELARAALSTLDLAKRAVFILHELDGWPIPEVATSLEIPLSTAYSRLRLAREDFARAARRLRRGER